MRIEATELLFSVTGPDWLKRPPPYKVVLLLAVSAFLLLLSLASFVLQRKDWRDKLAEAEAGEDVKA